jgi:hypothetical protein
LSGKRPVCTQRIVLSGDNAAAYTSHVRDNLGATLADGMKRIADAMASAERSMEAAGDHD